MGGGGGLVKVHKLGFELGTPEVQHKAFCTKQTVAFNCYYMINIFRDNL